MCKEERKNGANYGRWIDTGGKNRWRCGEIRRDRLVIEKQEKEEYSNDGGRGGKERIAGLCFILFLSFSVQGRCDRKK